MVKKKKQPRQKHVPQRTCIACRDKRDKRQLTRVVRTADSGLVLDKTGKIAGRGAYLCDKPTCWDNAVKRNLLAVALKTELTEAEVTMILASQSASISAET